MLEPIGHVSGIAPIEGGRYKLTVQLQDGSSVGFDVSDEEAGKYRIGDKMRLQRVAPKRRKKGE